jgi:hypothetical protein
MNGVTQVRRETSTELLQQAMEDSGQVRREDPKAPWRADHETQAQARARLKEEPTKVVTAAAQFAAKKLSSPLMTVASGSAMGALGARLAPEASAAAKAAAAAKNAVREGVRAALGVAGADGVIVGGLGAGAVGAAAVYARSVAASETLRLCTEADALDVAAVDLLQLDGAYKASQAKRFEGISASKTEPLFRDAHGELTARGRTQQPLLQAAADEGMRAALDSLSRGGHDPMGAFLRDNPDVPNRRATDVAFSKGFDSVLFAAGCADGKARLAAIAQGLAERHPEPADVRVKG